MIEDFVAMVHIVNTNMFVVYYAWIMLQEFALMVQPVNLFSMHYCYDIIV